MNRNIVLVLVIGLTAMACTRFACADEAKDDITPVVSLLELVLEADDDTARDCLTILSRKIHSGEVSEARLADLNAQLKDTVAGILDTGEKHPLYFDVALLAANWKQPAALSAVRAALRDKGQSMAIRIKALDSLIFAGDDMAIVGAAAILQAAKTVDDQAKSSVLSSLGKLDDARVADVVLAAYDGLGGELKPKAIELLTQRSGWSLALLSAIGQQRIAKNALNVNQVSKLLASRDESLRRAVLRNWGAVRTERNPRREQVIAEIKQFLMKTPGDPFHGEVVFHRVCGQCHKIHGRGQDVGPDITGNGRNSYEQLLSNVLDPSLVIGAAYQARVVITVDGRVLQGLPVEDSDQRLVLKVQGGKREVLARDQIDELKVSKLSLMPENLETQLKPQEIADLFAFLILDKPPSESSAKRIPGANEVAESRRGEP